MGQREVLNWLENQRALGNEKFLTIKEVSKGVKNVSNCSGLSNNLFKLASCGLIEWKGQGIWSHQKLFRGFKHK